MSLLRLAPIAALLMAALQQPAAAQYVPPRPGSCATGFTYSAQMCVPRGGGAANAYRPPNPGSCARGFTYSAQMCVPRR